MQTAREPRRGLHWDLCECVGQLTGARACDLRLHCVPLALAKRRAGLQDVHQLLLGVRVLGQSNRTPFSFLSAQVMWHVF
jgi:hypothetical protein